MVKHCKVFAKEYRGVGQPATAACAQSTEVCKQKRNSSNGLECSQLKTNNDSMQRTMKLVVEPGCVLGFFFSTNFVFARNNTCCWKKRFVKRLGRFRKFCTSMEGNRANIDGQIDAETAKNRWTGGCLRGFVFCTTGGLVVAI